MMESELMGFEVFNAGTNLKNDMESIRLIITEGYTRLSKAAMEALGWPKYVIVFFDDSRKRVMFQPRQAGDLNTLAVCSYGSRKPSAIYSRDLRKRLEKMAGGNAKDDGNIHVNGHVSKDSTIPAVIFSFDCSVKKQKLNRKRSDK